MANERRAAAALRRQAAEQHGERGGDAAYRRYRSAAPGIGTARKVPMKTQIRAASDVRNGKQMIHTYGYFTTYGRAYPMWDVYGEYEEVVNVGAGRETLASDPDVAWLVNHAGVTMARTKTTTASSREPTLILAEHDGGGYHDAWLNPDRRDVMDIVTAIKDGDVDQMSFAFMIPEGQGWWSEDFTSFEIRGYDIDRGDVSAVNYGANPYTDIAARTAEVLNDLEHLPEGALRAAADRLAKRSNLPILTSGERVTATITDEGFPRERIEVRAAIPQPGEYRSRLRARLGRTADRFDSVLDGQRASVAEVLAIRLPWFDIRNAAGEPDPETGDDAATVYLFDEIGGSFGVSAKEFVAQLDGITAPRINLRINSPGGSVFEGVTIHSALLHHPSKIRTYVDGLAASAASVIAQGADPYDPDTDSGGIVMMPGSQMMIHNASAMQDGDPSDMKWMMDHLEAQSNNIADMYARRAGGEPAEWRERMNAETWAFASEAVTLGLADKVWEAAPADETPKVADDMQQRMRRSHDLGRYGYRYRGRDAAPHPQVVRKARKLVDQDETERIEGLKRDFAAALNDQRTTPDAPKGRSIALIEAELARDSM